MKKEFFISFTTKTLDLLFNLAIVWMISHALGAELRGVFSTSMVSILLIANLLAFNWSNSALHHISAQPDKKRKYQIMASGYWSAIVWVGGLTMVAAAVLISTDLLNYLFTEITPAHIFTVVAFFMFYALSTALRGTILMEKGSNLVNYTLIFSRLLMLVGCGVLFLFGKFSVLHTLMLYAFYWFIHAALLLYYGKRPVSDASTEPSLYKSLMIYAMFAQISVIGSYLIFSADILMLNHFNPAADVGNYSLSMELVMAALALVQALAMVFYSKLLERSDHGWHSLKKNIYVIFAAVIGFCVVFSFAGGYLIRLTLGEEYLLASNLLIILIWCIPGHALAGLLGRFWMTEGKLKLASALALTIGLTNVILNLLWIPEYGVWGAAYASLAASIISGLVNLAFAKHMNNTIR